MTADARLAPLAARQHGAFTVAQAAAAGFSRAQIEHRVRLGTWTRLARGVLGIAGLPPTWRRSAIVPLLARPAAVLAERSAGQVHELVDAPLLRPSIAVPAGSSTRVPGAGIVHRWTIDPTEVTTKDGLRVTSVARTVADLAGVLPRSRIAPTVDTAIHGRGATPVGIDLAIASSSHLTAAERDAVLAATAAWQGIRPGSPGEVRLLRQLAEWGIPDPVKQVPIVDGAGETVARADVGWPAARFGLEYDTDDHHGPRRWASDEARHRAIAATGWAILHVAGRDLLPSADLRRRVERHLGRRTA